MLKRSTIKKAVVDNKLDLKYIRMSSADIELICSYLNEHPEISSLYLRSCWIDSEGAKILATNKTLTFLDVSFNPFDNEGVKALAANKTLTSLSVYFCNLDDEGLKFLAENKTLTSLNMKYNHPSDELKHTIRQRIALNIKITQYKKDCLSVVSLFNQPTSFFSQNRLPKEVSQLILEHLANEYELPNDPATINKLMNS